MESSPLKKAMSEMKSADPLGSGVLALSLVKTTLLPGWRVPERLKERPALGIFPATLKNSVSAVTQPVMM